MGDIALRGNRLTAAKGSRARLWHGGPHNTGRTNLLEQLGRVEGERSNPNRRAEISRVHGELNRGYKTGGRAGFAHGMSAIKRVVKRLQERKKKKRLSTEERELRPTGLGAAKGGRAGFRMGRIVPREEIKKKREELKTDKKTFGGERIPKKGPVIKKRIYQEPISPTVRAPEAEGGRIGLKKGGSDKKWIQKAVDPKHKGYCTPMTKKTCTPARKALARTFKKKAKTGWG